MQGHTPPPPPPPPEGHRPEAQLKSRTVRTTQDLKKGKFVAQIHDDMPATGSVLFIVDDTPPCAATNRQALALIQTEKDLGATHRGGRNAVPPRQPHDARVAVAAPYCFLWDTQHVDRSGRGPPHCWQLWPENWKSDHKFWVYSENQALVGFCRHFYMFMQEETDPIAAGDWPAVQRMMAGRLQRGLDCPKIGLLDMLSTRMVPVTKTGDTLVHNFQMPMSVVDQVAEESGRIRRLTYPRLWPTHALYKTTLVVKVDLLYLAENGRVLIPLGEMVDQGWDFEQLSVTIRTPHRPAAERMRRRG